MIENILIEALKNQGIDPPQKPVTTNSFTRWGKNNRYFAREFDSQLGWVYGDYSRDLKERCFKKPEHQLSTLEKNQRNAKIEETKRLITIEQEERHNNAAYKAKSIWQNAKPAIKHPYLQKKNVQSFGLKQQNQQLLIPMYNIDGKLCSIQFINHNGDKLFLLDGRKQGCYFPIGKPKEKIYICEGYATGATIHMATNDAVAVAFDAGNLAAVTTAISQKYPKLKVIVVADNDQYSQINTGLKKAIEASQSIGGDYVIPQFRDTKTMPTDFNDMYMLEGVETVETNLQKINSANTVQGENLNDNAISLEKQKTDTQKQTKSLHAITIDELLIKEFKPRDIILSPWLTTQSLSMIYAYRGVGKTHVSLGIAYAISSGNEFLGWKTDKPRGVLFVDGEMPGSALQERITKINDSYNNKSSAPLIFITPDCQEFGMPNLATETGQKQIEEFITDDIDLIIIDNLSCLAICGKENESESWLPMQEWALRLRSKGKSVLFIHHSNKAGSQRGTSRREDVLDTVISLKRPKDYSPDKGAHFEIHFEKARHLYGEDTESFEAQLITDSDGKQQWLTKTINESTFDKVVLLYRDGLTQKEIAEELDIHKSTVSRHIKEAIKQRLITEKKHG